MAGPDSFEAGPWKVSVRKSHILRSRCENKLEKGCPRDSSQRCVVCTFDQELDLSLPEMVFPESCLKVEHESGAALDFIALDALRLVNNQEDILKVAAAEEWGRLRSEGLQEVKEKAKPFDWTYTTSYKGTLSSTADVSFQVCETEKRIDYEKLKTQERIAFYNEVILFEDELADNGVAILSVKIRVMESGFFILQRFFLRVDGVLVRLNETRFYHSAGSNYLLREYTRKEAKITEIRVPLVIFLDLKTPNVPINVYNYLVSRSSEATTTKVAPPSFLTDPNKLSDIVPIRELVVHEIIIPQIHLNNSVT